MQKIIDDLEMPPVLVASVIGHTLRHLETTVSPAAEFTYYTMYGLFKFIHGKKLEPTIARAMLPEVYAHPKMVFDSVLTTTGYKKYSADEIFSNIPILRDKFAEIRTSPRPDAAVDWIMGNLRRMAMGNLPLKDVRARVEKEIGHE